MMTKTNVQVMQKPKRWDRPFSQEQLPPKERRPMSDSDIDQLLTIEPFSQMDPNRFPITLPLREILRNDVRIRSYRKGDAVVRAGDYGNSAFLVLDGSCHAIIEGLEQSVLGRQKKKTKGILNSLMGVFTNPKSPEVRDASTYYHQQTTTPDNNNDKVFVQDVPNVLERFPDVYDKTKNNLIPQGSLFGELSALGRVQRSVTVMASDPQETRLLEIRWQGLRELMKFDNALRIHVDKLFRKHGLSGALRSSSLLKKAQLTPQQWERVINEAEFETIGSYDWYGSYKELSEKGDKMLAQEPVVAQQGQYPNGLILIRAGFARLSRKHGNGEHTYGYLGKGDVYGLPELLHNIDSDEQLALQSTLRSAGYADIVRIPTRTFEQVIYPGLKEVIKRGELSKSLTGTYLDRRDNKSLIKNKPQKPLKERRKNNRVDPSLMEFFADNRIFNGTSTMIIDLDRCTRCDDCTTACASGHDNNPRFNRHGLIHGHYMIANACMHCQDPVCMIGCPTGAIHRSEGDGEVVINDQTCIGCSTCANSCPYNNIRMVNVRNKTGDQAIMVDPVKGQPIVKATKCDLCVEHHGGPACERACPHDALKRVNMEKLGSLVKWFNR